MSDWSIPVKTDWMKTQESHKPSMDYAKDIHFVASAIKDFDALEIGGAWGFSTLALLEAGAKTLLTVDPNQAAQAMAEAKASGYDNHVWNCVRSDTFWKENTATFDLIYVDGSHLYDDVRNDLYEAWDVLNPGGMLLADDWDHKKNNTVDDNGKFAEYGVSLAAWEFWRDHPCKAGIHGRVLWFRK